MIRIKPLLLLFVLSICLSSCYYYTSNASYIDENYTPIIAYKLAEFDIYAFNICECFDNNVVGKKRFINCPKDFFNSPVRDEFKKVEELYLLKHKNSNLIIYTTTFSHKYIRAKDGFLNDRDEYENKFYLIDTEYIYIAECSANEISFIQKKELNSMTWKLSQDLENNSVESFTVEKINTTTIETNGDEDIELNKTFDVPFFFEKVNYELWHKIGELSINEIRIVENKSKKSKEIHIVYKGDGDDEVIRFPKSRIYYHPF